MNSYHSCSVLLGGKYLCFLQLIHSSRPELFSFWIWRNCSKFIRDILSGLFLPQFSRCNWVQGIY